MPLTYANGHISATGDPIHFMFGSRVGFSGTADRTALFTVRTAAILDKFQMAISPQRLTIYLYSAHCAVIFAIAQLSCYMISASYQNPDT